MLERLTPARRNLALALLAVLLAWGAWNVRAVLNPLLLGYLLAYIVHPMVLQLERAGWQRRSAVNAIFAGAGLLGALLSVGLFLQGRSLAFRLTESDLFLNAEVQFQSTLARLDAWVAEWNADESEGASDGGTEAGSGANAEGAPAGGPGAGEGGQGEGGQGEGGPGEGGDRSAEIDSGASAAAAEPDAAEGASAASAESEPERAAVEPASGSGGARDPGTTFDGPLGELEDVTLGGFLSEFWSHLSEEQSSTATEAAVASAGGIWRLLSSLFGSLLAFGTLVVLLPVYTYFLLFELGTIHAFIWRYLPLSERDRLARVGGELGQVLANFFRGRLLVCLAKGLAISIGLWLAGIDYSLLLGLGSGFLSLVPFVGPAIGFLGAVLIGLLDLGDMTPLAMVLRLGVVFGLAEVLEGYVLLPKILGDSLGLHPVVVLASVMVGGAALGMFGFLIALPLTAGLILVCREFVLPALADFADERTGEGERAGGGGDPSGEDPAGEEQTSEGREDAGRAGGDEPALAGQESPAEAERDAASAKDASPPAELAGDPSEAVLEQPREPVDEPVRAEPVAESERPGPESIDQPRESAAETQPSARARRETRDSREIGRAARSTDKGFGAGVND